MNNRLWDNIERQSGGCIGTEVLEACGFNSEASKTNNVVSAFRATVS